MNASSISDQTLTMTTIRPPVNRPSLAFLERVCQALLGRPAYESDRLLYESLMGQGLSREHVVLAIMGSVQYRARAVQAIYRSLVHRPAPVTELFLLLQALATGASWKSVRLELLASEEYFASRGKGTNEGFLAALYEDLLGQRPHPARQRRDLQLLENGLQPTAMAQAILDEEEADSCLVRRWQQQYLHRPLNPIDLRTYIGRLQRGDRELGVLADLICSEPD